MKKLMNILVLSCKKATTLIEKREVESLSIGERVQLKVHTSMCKACSAYEKQSKTIDKALFKMVKDKKQEKQKLSDESKRNILSKIEKM